MAVPRGRLDSLEVPPLRRQCALLSGTTCSRAPTSAYLHSPSYHLKFYHTVCLSSRSAGCLRNDGSGATLLRRLKDVLAGRQVDAACLPPRLNEMGYDSPAASTHHILLQHAWIIKAKADYPRWNLCMAAAWRIYYSAPTARTTAAPTRAASPLALGGGRTDAPR